MRKLVFASLTGLAMAFCVAVPVTMKTSPAVAQHVPVKVKGAYVRMTISSRPAAAFMTIENHGDGDDRLISASTTDAGRTELHTHIKQDGIMKMRQVDAIVVPRHSKAELKPGGDHVMFFSLAPQVKAGHHMTVKLVFEKAGVVEVVAKVQTPGKKMDHSGHGSHENHGEHSHSQ